MTSGFPETEQQLAGLKISCYAEVYVESDSSAYLKVFKYINLLDTEILAHVFTPGGGGGPWVFFGWVCAARDSKLARRSRKNSPKIDTPF